MNQITLRIDGYGRLFSDNKMIETETDNVSFSDSSAPKTLYVNTSERNAMIIYDLQGVMLTRINSELKVYRDIPDESIVIQYKPLEFDWSLINVDMADKFSQGEEVDALMINYYLAEAKEALKSSLELDATAELINHTNDMANIDMKLLEAYVDSRIMIETLEDAIVVMLG